MQLFSKLASHALQGFHASNIRISDDGLRIEENFNDAHRGQIMFVIDEAAGVSDRVFEVAEGALASPNASLDGRQPDARHRLLCEQPQAQSPRLYRSALQIERQSLGGLRRGASPPSHIGLLYPVVALATVATVIAAQGLISGSFSLASQAVALGLFPRLRIIHTHHGHDGQIYIPFVNWALFAGCTALVLGFHSTEALPRSMALPCRASWSPHPSL